MTGVAAVVAAAAAAWVLVAGRAPVVAAGGRAGTRAADRGRVGGRGATDEAVDVAELDESALRQLLERLRARAPANVSALAAVGDAQDASDPSFDDDGR